MRIEALIMETGRNESRKQWCLTVRNRREGNCGLSACAMRYNRKIEKEAELSVNFGI